MTLFGAETKEFRDLKSNRSLISAEKGRSDNLQILVNIEGVGKDEWMANEGIREKNEE